ASYINALIERQKHMGAWAKRDAFYMLAADTEEMALLNWVADSYDLVNNSHVCTWSEDAYFKSNRTGGYLPSDFAPATAPNGKFAAGDGHMSIYSRTDLEAYEIGNSNTHIRRDADGALGGRPSYFSTRTL